MKEVRVVMHFLFHPVYLTAVQDLNEDVRSGELRDMRCGERSQSLECWMPGAELIFPDMDDAEVALVSDELLVTRTVVREEECQEIQDRASQGAQSGASLDHGLLQTPAVKAIFCFKCYGCVGA